MSTNLLPTGTSHNEEVTDTVHHTTNSNANEEKQSTDFLLTETKRLVRSGLYKKAFNLVETFKAELTSMSTINNIKLCRRMVFCLTKICDKYLDKGDIQRTEHFTTLMNKSYDYLQTWNDLLCTFIRKSNPKYENLQEALDEASALYDDGLEAVNISRLKTRKDTNNQSSTFISMGDTRDTRRSIVNNKPRQNTMMVKNRQSYLEDLSNVDLGPHLVSETFTGSEINVSYHLQEFIKYYLLTLLNWSNFFKKFAKRYDTAYTFLKIADKISKFIDCYLDPDLLDVVIKIKLSVGVFNCEFGRYQDALSVFESTINFLQNEISVKMSRTQQEKDSYIFKIKFKSTIQLLILVFMNMAITYEQSENYAKVLETLKFGVWFSTKFLNPDDDVYQSINLQNSIAQQRYDRYLKELGELERLIGARQDRLIEENKDTINSDHFAKVNQQLYNKFGYDKLNASQYIVLNNSTLNTRDSVRQPSRSDILLEDKHDLVESKQSWSKIKDMHSDISIGRTMVTQEDNDSPQTMASWKRQLITSKTSVKDKKKSRAKKLNLTADVETRHLTAEYYRTEVDLEKEREEFELHSEDEREYIEELNRNIKYGKKEIKKVVKKKNDDVFDLDHYFSSFVDQKIKQKEVEDKINPTTFKKMVKNYAHFVKKETYDKNEFGFAKRCLMARHKESLAEYTTDSKYKAPSYKVAQMNGVKVEAQHHEAKFEAESKINSRNSGLKGLANMKSQSAKFVKFVEPEAKGTSLIPIEESVSANNSKHNLVNILAKHRKELGIKSFDVSTQDQKNSATKPAFYSSMTKLNKSGTHQSRHSLSSSSFWRGRSGVSNGNGTEQQYDPSKIRTLSESTNNIIHLLMESVEKDMEESEHIKKRVQGSRPLVSSQKPNVRFLKVSDELAKSTQDIRHKLEGGKKIWNFSQAVKFAQTVSKKTVTIKTPVADS